MEQQTKQSLQIHQQLKKAITKNPNPLKYIKNKQSPNKNQTSLTNTQKALKNVTKATNSLNNTAKTIKSL